MLPTKLQPLRGALAFLLAAALISAKSPLNFDFPYNATNPVPFVATVDPEFIKQTVLKAALYRPSIDLVDNDEINGDWREGPDQAFMSDIAEYWSKSYDWSQSEHEIFSNFSHYAVTIPDGGGNYDHPVSFHFVHETSDNDNAIPLLVLHGWPSTHLEWAKVIGPLVSPEDKSSQAFHVVAPDLPGYGFSPAPTHSGLGASQMGAALDQLMKKLGYNRYALAGTDLGHFIGLTMNQQVPDSIIGYYSDMWYVAPNATDLVRYEQNQTTAEESKFIETYQYFTTNRYPWGPTHSIAPLGVGQALTDSPVGFAGWIIFFTKQLSDNYQYTFNEIITNTMLLLLQGTYSNIRLYREVFLKDIPKLRHTEVPAGAGIYGFPTLEPEIARYWADPPRNWIERVSNLHFYEHHEEGGHFPAINIPDIWVGDVRTFFGDLSMVNRAEK
ncbi:unnamed protein product [Clonostachys rosea]|uniref:Epoxide hydrolase N-terminal domain-containing protein n=1 Tax=Bionectria ochroleuca TaxID=29856 RepID=A0ABY6UKB6_BIOOC|nr:unnamed protein product [Clonostachys rosea]